MQGPTSAHFVASTLREVPRACEVDQPLQSDDTRWQDFSPARGDETGALERALAWKQPGDHLRCVLLSHRGAGKSTELNRLTHRLRARYSALYLEADVEMDPIQIDGEDLLLVLANRIEAHLRAEGLPLDPALLERVAEWFKQITLTTEWGRSSSAELSAGFEGHSGIPFFGRLFAGAKALIKQESKHRAEVKDVLKRNPAALLGAINGLLDAAQARLSESQRELLVVVDNLDRYEPAVIDRLLIQGASRLRGLRCSFIFTPPISLALKPHSGQLDGEYRCHHMTTIRLRSPTQGYRCLDGPGPALMRAALGKRFALDTLIPAEAAQRRLIAASGGALRELLDLITQSAYVAAGEHITEADVEEAIARRRQRIRDMVNASGWMPALKALASRKQLLGDGSLADDCMQLLFRRLAFKYNGEGWYDIHPLISELPEFQEASTP